MRQRESKKNRILRCQLGGKKMTDEEFLKLLSDELNVCICNSEIEKYKTGILNIAKKLKAANYKEEKELIKKIVQTAYFRMVR